MELVLSVKDPEQVEDEEWAEDREWGALAVIAQAPVRQETAYVLHAEQNFRIRQEHHVRQLTAPNVELK